VVGRHTSDTARATWLDDYAGTNGAWPLLITTDEYPISFRTIVSV
jgi:hypothetical protein